MIEPGDKATDEGPEARNNTNRDGDLQSPPLPLYNLCCFEGIL